MTQKLTSEREKEIDDYLSSPSGQKPLLNVTGALRELRGEIASLREENGHLGDDRNVPGHFQCPKCKFYLISKTLYAQSGNVGANKEPTECSNGCGPMWRVAWADYARFLVSQCEEKDKELAVARERLGPAGYKIITDVVRLRKVLIELCEVKRIKDVQGDTPEYRARKAPAWEAALACFHEYTPSPPKELP